MLYFIFIQIQKTNSTKTVDKINFVCYNENCKGGDYKNAY